MCPHCGLFSNSKKDRAVFAIRMIAKLGLCPPGACARMSISVSARLYSWLPTPRQWPGRAAQWP
eukprot:scaffold655_cov105-Isochrysis_galbana.AAC.3